MASPSVIVPGNLDGVHRGHRALLAAARQRAIRGDLRVTAMFFDPHPMEVLLPERAPVRLTMPERRRALLRGAGADAVVAQRFDEAFAKLSPEDFARRVLAEAQGARGVVIGPDFRFGHRRAGDLAALRTLGAELGFDVTVVEPVRHAGGVVSSSRVREHVAEGDVEGAAELLLRVHEVEGTVVRGDERGRAIGFPTANLAPDPVLLPGDGVYAVVARDLDAPAAPRLGGVANLGTRPTFAAGRAVEVHLFDFQGDLYGHRLRVGFVSRIRGERRFDGVEALKARIARDADAAREAIRGVDGELVGWV